MSNFQDENWTWIHECFGDAFASSRTERALRFLEEALELAQSSGIGRDYAGRLLDYVFGRPAGEVRQEVGGVMVCLAALCSQAGVDMEQAGWDELRRCHLNTKRIREKHLSKAIGIRTSHSI